MATPFGMLFEEKISNIPPGIRPIYDAVEQISFCFDEQGERTPFVTFGFKTMGATSTGTATKQATDRGAVDSDPSPRPTETQTFSEVRAEVTDTDRSMVSN